MSEYETIFVQNTKSSKVARVSVKGLGEEERFERAKDMAISNAEFTPEEKSDLNCVHGYTWVWS